jgi:hypothetical protein
MAARLSLANRLERAVRPWVQRAELGRAVRRCEAELRKLKASEYQVAIGRTWLRQTEEAARWLGRFYKTASKTTPVRAVYCEMNRFEINTDQWYLDAFAYDFFGEPDDLGWLVGWKKSNSDRKRFVLRGMNDLQRLFARDDVEQPQASVQSASEVVVLLLTLRMQELVHTASEHARQAGLLPEDVPILSATHDSDLVCCSYGSVVPPVTRHEPARPTIARPRKARTRLGIYMIDGGFDQIGNSLPWDVLDYARQQDQQAFSDRLDQAKRLAKTWAAPRVNLRKRKWRCDLISLYPHWAVNDKARAALEQLLKGHVEFLPLRCDAFPQLWVLHPLRHIDLATDAEHNAAGRACNMTAIRRYSFEIEALQGLHLFGVKQAIGSPARRAGYCFGADYVSEQFRQLVATSELQGVVFEKVFSYRQKEGSA